MGRLDAKLAELEKQMDVLEGLIQAPYAAGASLTEADFALYPTLACFLPYLLPTVFGWADPLDASRRRAHLHQAHLGGAAHQAAGLPPACEGAAARAPAA